MLFSEPKIPQYHGSQETSSAPDQFQCSSASRKFLNGKSPYEALLPWRRFSALQRAENSSISSRPGSTARRFRVSVLFSEPKIPQFQRNRLRRCVVDGFSALQRAENSSIRLAPTHASAIVEFQCSSASRKFLNLDHRARNRGQVRFQCSSASRKFLNRTVAPNAPIQHKFQCSSASRKFLNERLGTARLAAIRFQCSSASRKFLNKQASLEAPIAPTFQCSSASRKFLNCIGLRHGAAPTATVSVLFSEPKIPQYRPSHLRPSIFPTAMITLRHS